jgi:hypothetical protein
MISRDAGSTGRERPAWRSVSRLKPAACAAPVAGTKAGSPALPPDRAVVDGRLLLSAPREFLTPAP